MSPHRAGWRRHSGVELYSYTGQFFTPNCLRCCSPRTAQYCTLERGKMGKSLAGIWDNLARCSSQLRGRWPQIRWKLLDPKFMSKFFKLFRPSEQKLMSSINQRIQLCNSPCGRFLLSASTDGSVRVWDTSQAPDPQVWTWQYVYAPESKEPDNLLENFEPDKMSEYEMIFKHLNSKNLTSFSNMKQYLSTWSSDWSPPSTSSLAVTR